MQDMHNMSCMRQLFHVRGIMNRRLLTQKFLLIVGIILCYFLATYLDMSAMNYAGRFEGRKAGILILLSSALFILLGICLIFLLPEENSRHMSSHQIKWILVLAGFVPLLTLIERIGNSLQLFQPLFYYAARFSRPVALYWRVWTIRSPVPPVWLGIVVGWWLRWLIQNDGYSIIGGGRHRNQNSQRDV